MLALVVRSSDIPLSPTDTSTLSSRRFASFGGVEVEEGLGYPAYTDLPRGLEYKAVEVLRNARRILDKWESEKGRDVSATTATTSLTTGGTNAGTNGMRRFAVAERDTGGPVLASLGFSSTAGWLFEGQSTIRQVHCSEVESRGADASYSSEETAQSWSNSHARQLRKVGTLASDYRAQSKVGMNARFIWRLPGRIQTW